MQLHHEFDVLACRQHRNQVVRLEHESDSVQPQSREFRTLHRIDALAVHFDFSGGRPIKTTDEIEQRALAGTRGSGKTGEILTRDFQIDIRQRVHCDGVLAVYLADVTADDGIVHGIGFHIHTRVIASTGTRRAARQAGYRLASIPSTITMAFDATISVSLTIG